MQAPMLPLLHDPNRGGMVREWLEALLPEDAHERCRVRVHLLR